MLVTDTDETRGLFGARVRLARQEMGLSQEELAARMADAGYRMHQTTVAKIENGSRPTSVDEAVTLAGVLGTTVSDLLASGDAKVERTRARLVALRAEDAAVTRRLDKAHQDAADAQEHLFKLRTTIGEVEATMDSLVKTTNRG